MALGKDVIVVKTVILPAIFNRLLHTLVSNQIESKRMPKSCVDLYAAFMLCTICDFFIVFVFKKIGIAIIILRTELFITA